MINDWYIKYLNLSLIKKWYKNLLYIIILSVFLVEINFFRNSKNWMITDDETINKHQILFIYKSFYINTKHKLYKRTYSKNPRSALPERKNKYIPRKIFANKIQNTQQQHIHFICEFSCFSTMIYTKRYFSGRREYCFTVWARRFMASNCRKTAKRELAFWIWWKFLASFPSRSLSSWSW